MSTSAQYASTPKCGVVQVSVANTNRDGTGTIATIFTAGASGSRIDRVTVEAVAATTAGMVRLFIHDGVNSRLYNEIPVPAVTPSGTTPAFRYQLPIEGGLALPTDYSLRASTNNAETFNVIAQGGDF